MSKESAVAMMAGAAPTTTPADNSPGLVAVPDAPKVETPAELDSARFAHLAKKEAALQKEREAFKKERELFTSQKTRAEQIEAKYNEFEGLRAKDPVQALRNIGFSETEIFNFLATQEKAELTPEEKAAKVAKAAADEAIQSFEEKQAEKIKAEQQERDTKALDGFKKQIGGLISSNKEKYEFCAYKGKEAEDRIYNLVLASAALSNGVDVITAEEAAEDVEKFYEDEDKAMNTLKKRGYTPPVEAPVEPEAKPAQKTRTISNAATATAAAVVNAAAKRPETHTEKKARLAQRLVSGG